MEIIHDKLQLDNYSGILTSETILTRARASQFSHITKLNCWGLSITDASLIKELPNLEFCSVSANQISTLEVFSHCLNLQELYIRKNRIDRLEEICHLKCLHKLRVLWLSDNPCSCEDNYRHTVLKTLPNLQKLDNTAVSEDELNDALELGRDLQLLPKSTKPAPAKRLKVGEKVGGGDMLTNGETNKICIEQRLNPVNPDYRESETLPSTENTIRNERTVQSILLLLQDLDIPSLHVIKQAIDDRLTQP